MRATTRHPRHAIQSPSRHEPQRSEPPRSHSPAFAALYTLQTSQTAPEQHNRPPCREPLCSEPQCSPLLAPPLAEAISSPPALLGTDRPHAGLTIEASDAKRTNALLHSIEPRADIRPPPTPPKPTSPKRSPSPLPRATQKSRSPSPSASSGGILKPTTVLTGLLAQTGAATALPLPASALSAPVESMNLFPAELQLFPREHAFPFSSDFEWPRLDYFALHEHSGEFREAWPGASCSVANRPTNLPPGEGKFHFVMDVYHFVAVYPYPLGIVTTVRRPRGRLP